MPTRPEPSKKVSDINTADLLNTIRSENGAEYADIVPQAIKPGDTLPNGETATKDDALRSLRGIGQALVNFPFARNAFVDAINRIAMVVIKSKLYENPIAFFKRGFLEYGETIEELFVEMLTVHQYDMTPEPGDPFKREMPNVRSAFHAMNFEKYYEVTVYVRQLKQAFLSWEGVNDLITKIIEQVYTSANYDEFLVMKYMIARAALNGHLGVKVVNAPTAANAREITTELVTMARDMTFMHNDFNAAGVTTYTDISRMYTILTNKVSSLFNVEVLATSFNMDKAELLGRQIFVDDFGIWDEKRLAMIFKDDPYTIYTPFTAAEKSQLATIIGLMVDENWFMIYDMDYSMESIYNPKQRYWNYYYHVVKLFSFSPFENARLITTTASSVTAVAVSSPVTTATPGTAINVSKTVTGSGFYNAAVIWDVAGNNSPNTVINQDGNLVIAANETANAVVVTATSVADPSVKGSVTITLT